MLSGARYIGQAGKGFNWIACAAVVVMMLLSTADVILRLFNKPIPGAYEIIGFLGTVIVSFALAFTSLEKGHIAVEILVEKLPERLQSAIESFNNLLGALFFGLISFQAVVYAIDIKRSGEVSLTIQMPIYPFIFGIAVGCGLLALLLMADLIKSLKRTFPG
ncbi:MAG: TRAP transporter small permease [Deltaproteobacteria bacterium]|nr:TRAP transporter small permease [Deltaproteobacteria bacterium]